MALTSYWTVTRKAVGMKIHPLMLMIPIIISVLFYLLGPVLLNIDFTEFPGWAEQ